MAKKQFKKFVATITYKIEVNEDYQPTVKDERANWKALVGTDPEITAPKFEVEEV